MPDNRVPTVQPSAIIAPHPIKMPPVSAARLPLRRGMLGRKRPASSAAPNEPVTNPPMSQPLVVMVCHLGCAAGETV